MLKMPLESKHSKRDVSLQRISSSLSSMVDLRSVAVRSMLPSGRTQDKRDGNSLSFIYSSKNKNKVNNNNNNNDEILLKSI